MKAWKICVVLVILLFVTVNISFANPRTITVQGSSQLEVIPDQAHITVSYSNKAEYLEEARRLNAVTTANIQRQLLQLDLSKDDIRTNNYSVYPIYSKRENNSAAKIIGYEITNSLSVTVNNIDLTGHVIDTALKAGANQIQGVSFSKKDKTAVKNTALTMAVRDAQVKAQAIAATLNKNIINIISVSEGSVSIQIPERYQYSAKALPAATTPISPGVQHVSGSVTIVFEMD